MGKNNQQILRDRPLAFRGALTLLDLLDQTETIRVWMKDRTGAFQWANNAMIAQYSETKNPLDVLGKTDYDLSPKELADKFREDDEKVLHGQPVIGRIEQVTGADHLARTISVTKLPVRDSEGQIIGTVGFTQHVAEKQAEDLSSTLLTALSHIRSHFTEPLDLQKLAELTGASLSELEELFAKELKLSPEDYLRRTRVRLACHDLVDAQNKFEDIAIKYGFIDQADFVQQFQRETGETPRSYRMKLFQRGAVRL
jgi:AraC-like DNA-binding protein